MRGKEPWGRTTTRLTRVQSTQIALRANECEGAGIIFQQKNSRAGVASTYVEFERSEKLYLVTCDHKKIIVAHTDFDSEASRWVPNQKNKYGIRYCLYGKCI